MDPSPAACALCGHVFDSAEAPAFATMVGRSIRALCAHCTAEPGEIEASATLLRLVTRDVGTGVALPGSRGRRALAARGPGPGDGMEQAHAEGGLGASDCAAPA
jgi:hypothetical protein